VTFGTKKATISSDTQLPPLSAKMKKILQPPLRVYEENDVNKE
jgi:hypothetical protein